MIKSSAKKKYVKYLISYISFLILFEKIKFKIKKVTFSELQL